MPHDKPTAREQRVLAEHRIHGTLIRWLYRVLTPRHPRGWLDFHPLIDDHDPNLFSSIHCHGMGRWNLPNIEIVNVPRDLGGFAHGIMFDIVGYMKERRAIQADETFGGLLVSKEQVVPHQCSFRLIERADEQVEKTFLRVVDLNEPAESGFPKRLFSTHLLALAETARNPARRVDLLRRSVDIYPGEPNCGPDDENAAGENPGNFFSWQSLGDALCDTGEIDEGLHCLQTAVERWPCGGWKNAAVIVEAIRNGQLPPPEEDPRSKFWTELARKNCA